MRFRRYVFNLIGKKLKNELWHATVQVGRIQIAENPIREQELNGSLD